MVLEAIKYTRGKLEILDQLRLPHREVYVVITTVEEAWHAIRDMKVRGAPAIAIVAALALAVELENAAIDEDASNAQNPIIEKLRYLVTSRPTAVNLADAARKLEQVVRRTSEEETFSKNIKDAYITAAEQMLVDDVSDNMAIGRYGAEWIKNHSTKSLTDEKVTVLTHCNTGSLATAGYGTALGVVRSLHASDALRNVYYTETRPYNQGSRLTGYELLHDGIPATLITDSMAATLFQLKGRTENICAVIVGADRVAANGDTANKIGTYALAILAHHHGISFLVAAPRTTIDLNTPSGAAIPIEERPELEMTVVKGPRFVTQNGTKQLDKDSTDEVSIAPEGTRAWNPAFDVTPAALISGIVTEVGVLEKEPGRDRFDLEAVFASKAKENGRWEEGVRKRMPSPSEGP